MLVLVPLAAAVSAAAPGPAAAAAAVTAPGQDPLRELGERILAAKDRRSYLEHDAYQAAKALAELRTPAAMHLRLMLFEEKRDTYRGVFLREWFYTGMRRAASIEETDVLLETAADRRRSAWLRVLCLRALANCDAPVRLEPLLDRGLQRADGEVQRSWQDALGRCAAEGRLHDEDDGKSGRQERGRAGAGSAWREALLEAGPPGLGFRHLSAWSDEELAMVADAAAGADDAGDRAQAIRVLATQADAVRDASAAFVRAAALAFGDDHPGPRAAVLDAAAEQRIHEVVPVLIDVFEEVADDGPSRWIPDLAHCLRTVTGMQFPDSPERWRAWWSDAGEQWLADARAGKSHGPPERRESDTAARFFGVAVDSLDVAVLVDGSGSMSSNQLGEISCVEAAAREVQRFLDAMPKGARFNVVVVESEPVAGFDRMQRVTRSAREEAADFLRRREYRSTSALYEALALAMGNPEVDTLILISDGGSSAGRHQHDEHLLESVVPLYERTGVRIHAVHVTDGDRHADVMRGLAEITGGKMVRPSG